MQTKTLIVIPCYNEEHRFKKEAYAEFLTSHSDLYLLFVNDGSKDDTGTMLTIFTREYSNAALLNVRVNRGKAEAVRAGIQHALKLGKFDYLGYWDADLATPLDQIPEFIQLAQTKNKSLVMGCRLLRLGADIRRQHSRHYIGRVFATLASYVLGLAVYDTQCGAKLFSKEIAAIGFANPFKTKWLFDVEILARLVIYYGYPAMNALAYEFPLPSWEDVGGSQLKPKDFLKAPYQLFKIWNSYGKGIHDQQQKIQSNGEAQ